MQKVVHLKLNAKEGYGKEVADQLKLGSGFPHYVVLNKNGELVTRWTGYSTVEKFQKSFDRAFSNLTTIDKRVNHFKGKPSRGNAHFLARYYTEISDYLQARFYYQQAQKLTTDNKFNFRYDIFKNISNAIWNDLLPFADAIPALDDVIANPKIKNDLINGVRMLVRVARRTGHENEVGKYIEIGITASKNAKDDKTKSRHIDFLADYALCVESDTAKAISIKEKSLKPDWKTDHRQYYSYSRWCFERKVNLVQAESYARKASELFPSGKAKGTSLNNLAEICFVLGRTDDAIDAIKIAMDEYPEAEYFEKNLYKYLGR